MSIRVKNSIRTITLFLITIACIIGFIPSMSFAFNSNGWLYQDKYPTSNTILSVKFITPNKGWIVGERGMILYTEDSGDTWQEQESGSEEDLHSIFFVNEKQGWAAGNAGVIIHTADGGKTWYRQGDAAASLHKIFMLNDKEGWAGGDRGILWHTVDGGKQWARLPLNTSSSIAGIFFTDANTGWILAGGKVFRTDNGGKQWEESLLPVKWPNQGAIGRGPSMSGMGEDMPDDWWQGDIFFTDAKKGWAVVGLSYICSTADGGKTWVNQYGSVYMSYGLGTLSFLNEKSGCAIGSSILCTEDGGQTWKERLGVTSGERGTLEGYLLSLWGLSFVNPSTGWAVGNDGQIMKTEDGGKTWKMKSRARFGNIYFLNAKVGWAVKGGIWGTTDGGATWEIQEKIEKPANLRFFFVSPTIGWAVGWRWRHDPMWGYTLTGAVIFHTSDGGKTWITQFDKPGKKLALLDAFFVSPDLGWVVGSNGFVMHTVDGGKQWIQQKSSTKFRLEKVQFVDSKMGWAIGVKGGATEIFDKPEEQEEGIILQTSDGGEHWHTQWTKRDRWLNGLFFLNRKNGWATGKTFVRGERGLILHTNNGGNSWMENETAENFPAEPFFFDKYHGYTQLLTQTNYLITKERLLFLTDNGGKTWESQKVGVYKYPWRPFDDLIKK